MALRPKYSLNKTALQGDRYTIPARPFTQLTTRRYPYPRVGTRAPNGMFPNVYPSGLGALVQPGYGHGNGNPLEIVQEKAHYGLGNGKPMRPHYTLNKPAVQGVMPSSTYAQMTGKLTTSPQMPRYTEQNQQLVRHEPPTVPPYSPTELVSPMGRVEHVVSSPYGKQADLRRVATPSLEFDWGTFFWGAVGGGVAALLMVYGVIPALAEWGAAAIKKRY